MRLIWHIIWKDIVRERWALLLWVLLFAAQIGLGVVVLGRDAVPDVTQLADLKSSAGAIVFLQVVLGYVLVARLVQADPAVGTNLFWVTRPISAGRMLVAKALGALLSVGLLPVLLLLPWWLYCHFDARAVLWTAVETVGWQLLVIAPAFLIASLADNPGRVLLATLLLAMGAVALGMIVPVVVVTSPAWNRSGGGIMFTRYWLAGMLLIVGAGGIALHQFLTRRLLRSVVMAVALYGLIALVYSLAPWDLTDAFGKLHRTASVSVAAGIADGIKLEVLAARGSTRARIGNTAELIVAIKALGVPDGMRLAGYDVEQTWRWPDNRLNLRRGNFNGGFDPRSLVAKTLSLPVYADDPETVAWWRARREQENQDRIARGLPASTRLTPWPPMQQGEVRMTGYNRLDRESLDRMRAEPPAYQAGMQCILSRPEIMSELPLVLNARAAHAAHTVRVVAFEEAAPETNGSQEWQLTLAGTVPLVDWVGLWGGAEAGRSNPVWVRTYQRDHVMAANRVTGLIQSVGTIGAPSPQLRIGGVGINLIKYALRSGRVIRNGQWVAQDPQWREHTTLLLIADREIARFERTVTTERFEIAPLSTDN